MAKKYPPLMNGFSLETARVSLKFVLKENKRLRIINAMLGGDFDKNLHNNYIRNLRNRLSLSEKANCKKRATIRKLKEEIEILKGKLKPYNK